MPYDRTKSPYRRHYLGDSVYAAFDGFGIALTTENGLPDDPSNRIYLEPEVCAALIKLVESLKKPEAEVRRGS